MRTWASLQSPMCHTRSESGAAVQQASASFLCVGGGLAWLEEAWGKHMRKQGIPWQL